MDEKIKEKIKEKIELREKMDAIRWDITITFVATGFVFFLSIFFATMGIFTRLTMYDMGYTTIVTVYGLLGIISLGIAIWQLKVTITRANVYRRYRKRTIIGLFDKGYSDDDVQFCICISDQKLLQLKLNYVAGLINDQIRASRDH